MSMTETETNLYKEVITSFFIRLKKEQVFQTAGGRSEDSAFCCLEEAFSVVEEWFYKLIQPKVILKEQKTPEPAVLVFLTLGQKVTDFSSYCMQKGEYLQGLLLDVMADLYLFEADRAVRQRIKEFCAVRELGVEKRAEAPADFSFEVQKQLVASMTEEEDGIFVTEGGMLSPVKSMFYLCRLTKEAGIFRVQHDCRKCPAKNCRMRRSQAEEEGSFQIVSEWKEGFAKQEQPQKESLSAAFSFIQEQPKVLKSQKKTEYDIAADIGTTTLALTLTEAGKPCAGYCAVNPQRSYGMDVISRIQSAQGKTAELLKRLVQEALLKGIRYCARQEDLEGHEIKRIGIAGNTAMVQILLGVSCKGLEKYPFSIEKKGEICLSFAEVFGAGTEFSEAAVVILPAIAPFIGGDITAGLLKCGFGQKEKPAFFLDLGTNGEMVIGCRGNYLCASTAAGPAFEGGNITHGTGSVTGAVCGAEIKGRLPRIRTIGNQLPVGICGTGVMELTAELLKKGILGTDGRLEERYFASGYPYAKMRTGEPLVFYQSDVRELQLAKGAVCAGIELLLEQFGIQAEEVEEVYLAGGFGYHMDVEKAFRIGLFPKGFKGKVKAAGNTALAGAAAYLVQEGAKEAAAEFCSFSKEIILAKEPGFSEKYITRMDFPKDC